MLSLFSRSSISLLLIILLFTGCGKIKRGTPVEEGIHKQIFHFGNNAEPQGLDPQTATSGAEFRIIAALFEGLVSEDPKDAHPVPGVAEKWDISEDGKIYTFHLRHNTKWSNDDPVTAHDFLKSYKRILSPTLKSETSGMLFVVKNAEAYNKGAVTDFNEVGFKTLDDFTLQITLTYPTPYFLSLITTVPWLPVHIPTIEKYGKIDELGNRWTRAGNFVGNGSFNLVEWKISQVIIVKKNPTYWDADKVRLQEIHFYPIESPDTEERAFRSGQLHLTNKIPFSKVDTYRQKNPEFLRIDPYLGTYLYLVNVTKPILKNKKVRRALAMAIDRKSLVEKVTLGGEQPAYSFTPPNTGGYTARAQIPTDIEAAKKLLAEAGYPDGKGFPPLEILFNTSENHKIIAEAIQQMWKKHLNIEVGLVNQEFKVFFETQRQLNYQICRSRGWTGDFMDPSTFLEAFITKGSNNYTGWSNLEYDRLITEAAQTGDSQARFELFQKAEAILLDEAPIIPIYFYTQPYLLHPSVKGWYPVIINNRPYKYVYLESTKN